ncbi:homeobox protein HOY1 [Apiospora saccharicola]
MMNTIKEEQHGMMAPTAMDQMQSDLTLTPASSTSPSDEHLKGSESPSPSASGKTPSSASRRPRGRAPSLSSRRTRSDSAPPKITTVRERIADEINMTERSVQIWFQNRRAKIKLLAKKSLETGEDIDSIPESMRAYLAMQAMESGKGLGGAFLGRTGLIPYGSSMMLGGDQSGQGKVLIHHLTCRSLSIGKWTRVGQNTMDLIIFYSPEKCTMTYYINNDQAGYKIEYHFSHIKSITLDSNEGDANKLGGIVIELNRPPNFFMDSSPNSNGFFQCGDFTEDQQATQCYTHHLGGNPKVLSSQLAKLVSLESFMNRHNPNAFYDQGHAMGVASAPVSPTGNRPSSQPNFGQGHVGMFQESQWGISPLIPCAPAPATRDSANPMPSFYIQHPGENQGHPHNPNIFAPVPQQPQQQLHSPVGPNLRIDTQAGFGMDLRPYPLSAATTAPSEYSSPNYFAQDQHTPLPTSNFNTPYSSTFLSPMVNPAMVPQSVSPLPFNHGDPAIVEQSPPMGMMRSASADLYPMGDSTVSDDGHSLNEMYSKHTINLPMHPHSPGFMDGSQGDLDMNQLVQFDGMDPSSMSPEHMSHQQQ